MTDQPRNDVAPPDRVPEPRITVIGVGGAGGNAIDNMIRAGLEGVGFVVANTDAQAMQQSLCETQIQLGAIATHGLGAGARPEIGQVAAEEAMEEIVNALKGSNMAFITAGMGGGTGTGGAPVIARAARDEGVLTVGVVTKPFDFEGGHRMRQAEAGIAELSQYVDTLIVIPNQNLFLIADDKTTFADAFKLADEVLHSGVRGVTDLMVLPGLVNLDFADVRSIMAGMGKAVMGTGEAEGDDRALAAAEAAISNPLLDDISMKGARSVLINITGGLDLMLMEVDEAANRIRAEVDPNANIIFGSAFSESLNGKIRVSVIATGNDIETKVRSTPQTGRPFVGEQAERRDVKQPAQASAASAVEQAAAPAEPLTLRIVSTIPANAEPAPRQEPADTTPAGTTGELSTDPAGTRFIWEPDQDTDGEISASGPAETPEPAALFQRPARPVKSETTLETFKKVRVREQPAEAVAEKMHYVVWEVDLGARIYKVPEAKLATVGQERHAGKLKLFDTLENAKAEANAIFKRVAAERAARGLSRSILEPTLEDLMRWDENNVPHYFL